MTTISRRPKKVIRVNSSKGVVNVQGWWYENAGSIEVYLRDNDGKHTLTGRIRRADLADWLTRTRTEKS